MPDVMIINNTRYACIIFLGAGKKLSSYILSSLLLPVLKHSTPLCRESLHNTQDQLKSLVTVRAGQTTTIVWRTTHLFR